MDFIRTFIGFVIIIGLALLLGRLDHQKHPEAFTYVSIGSIVLLLSLRFFL